jgi:hypothetical protein
MKNSKDSTEKKKIDTNFDDLVSHKYSVKVFISPDKTENICFSFKKPAKDEGCLTYDHVESAAFDAMEKRFPLEYYPKRDVVDYIYIKDDTEWYPVVSESDKKTISKLSKDKKFSKFLILPDAIYSLSPELLLYLKMCDEGILNPKDKFGQFNYEKMHHIIEGMKDGSDDASKHFKKRQK